MQKILLRLTIWLVYGYLLLLKKTCRLKVVNPEVLAEAISASPARSATFAIWHENAIAGTLSHIPEKLCPMVSQSSDGELVARLYQMLGLACVRGSSSRGGRSAREEMLHYIAAGHTGAFTVDGPRGPYHKVKSGVVQVAAASQTHVVPVTVVADRQWVLHKSWDKHKIPKPFSRLLILYGAALPVEASVNEDREALNQEKAKVETSMLEIDQRARLNFDLLWQSATPKSMNPPKKTP